MDWSEGVGVEGEVYHGGDELFVGVNDGDEVGGVRMWHQVQCDDV